MNIHGLRIFHTIASSGGVTKAAEQLNISQPAVTMQLHKLENELGVKLTRHHGRGLVLTEAGEWLASQAARLFALEADIDKQCEAYRRGATGTLMLSATYLPANYLLPSWLAEYRITHPDVQVSLSSGNARTALDMLLRYEADIAWVGGHHERYPEGIDASIHVRDELWFVVPPEHVYANRTVSLQKLVELPYIMREPGSYTREAVLSLCQSAGVPSPVPALQVTGPQEALRAVLAGLGITLASAMEVKEYVDAGALARTHVDGVRLSNAIACCTRSDDPLPPQARAFLDLVRLKQKGSSLI